MLTITASVVPTVRIMTALSENNRQKKTKKTVPGALYVQREEKVATLDQLCPKSVNLEN